MDARRAIEEPFAYAVIEKYTGAFFKDNAAACFFFKTKIKVIRTFFFEVFVESWAFDEKVPCADREQAAVRGINKIIF